MSNLRESSTHESSCENGKLLLGNVDRRNQPSTWINIRLAGEPQHARTTVNGSHLAQSKPCPGDVKIVYGQSLSDEPSRHLLAQPPPFAFNRRVSRLRES